MDKDYIERIAEIMEERKQRNPLNVEFDRITRKMFPMEEVEEVFILGQVTMLSAIKKGMYKYMCKNCREYFDVIINSYRKHDNTKDMANKLIE